MDKIFHLVCDISLVCVLIITFGNAIRVVMLKNQARRAVRGISEAQKILSELPNEVRERITLLSKENMKVAEENEMLKERLRNLGIKDFDVIK